MADKPKPENESNSGDEPDFDEDDIEIIDGIWDAIGLDDTDHADEDKTIDDLESE